MQEDFLQDRTQSSRPRAPHQRKICDLLERVSGELQLDAIDLEEPLVLLDKGVLGFGENLDECLAVELGDRREDREAPDELRDHPVLQ